MNITTYTPARKDRHCDAVNTWNAARVIGEVFGWEHLTAADWESLAECPPVNFKLHEKDQHLRTSIYQELEPLWQQCNPENSDYSALQPSDTVNQNLTALVRIICTRFGCASDTEKAQQDRHHQEVVSEVLSRIQTDRQLSEKMHVLRTIAGYAEGEMECYYAKLINEKMEQHDFIEANRLPANAGRQERMQRFKELLTPFPYIDNYEKIVEAETKLMQQPLDPHYFRIEDMDEQALSRGNGVISEKIARVKHKATELMETMTGKPSVNRNIAFFDDLNITFPGSGSLPLTGIMLHIQTGAKLNLIDIDPEAIRESKRLIGNLEKLGVVQPNHIKIIEADATNVHYQKPEKAAVSDLVSADTIRATMRNDSKARFATKRHAIGVRRNGNPHIQDEFDDALPKDDFSYVPHYSPPDKQTPYAVSFTGYKTVTDDKGTHTLSHKIYFDKDLGWKRSGDRLLVPSDIVFMASLIPEELRQKVVDRILQQTHVPDAIMMRSVKGLAQLVYPPTNTNRLADTRAPFYGEAVPETHIVAGNASSAKPARGTITIFNPSLVIADSEVLNSTEIHYLPFSRVLRGRTDHAASEFERLDQMEKDIDSTNAKLKRLKKLAEDPLKTSARWAISDIGMGGMGYQ